MRTRLWIFLHALIAVVPAVGVFVHFPDVALFGSEVPPVLPSVTFTAWRSEQVQPALQAWFEAHIGFRGVMVRTDNSVQAAVLREKPLHSVVIGNDGTLLYADDVAYMGARREELPAVFARVDALTRALGSVSKKLKARGKELVVVIAPSKTAVYPESVPAGWRRAPGYRADVEVDTRLRAALERDGVPFADAHQLLSGRHGEERQRLFAATGRHWTQLGACVVLREVLPRGGVMPSCAYDMAPADVNVGDDFDLYRLQNLWRYEREVPVYPKLREEGAAAGSPSLPRAVFAGTSFTWMLADVMRPFVSAPVAIFYNTNIYDVSEPARRLLAPANPDSPEWTGYVLDRDLYILEILETYAHGEHMISFVETLDRKLGPLE